MLRKIKLENFVHFKNATLEIDKDAGPMFFIGQNNTGKTSMFEAIRRCMSTSKTLTLSSAHDVDKPMFVTCQFTGLSSDQQQQVFSSLYRPAGKTEEHRDEFCLKFVCVKNGDETLTLACDMIKENQQNKMANATLDLKDDLEAVLKEIYNGQEQFSGNLFTQKIQSYLEHFDEFAKKANPGEYKETKCETKLKEHIDMSTIITFPLRSVSPYQWTNSSRLQHDYDAENMQQASERAEILSWYLDENSVTDVEREKEQDIFNLITNHSGFKFEKENGIITANERNGHGPYKVSLLKIPEGIFEAKRVAILLCVDNFKTVCLEDPDRGMHAQMIERLRDLVLYEIKDKTILITTHQPTVLSPWTVPRTILFQKYKPSSGRHYHRIKPLKDIHTEGKRGDRTRTGDKTIRIISSNHFSTIFFAKRIIFVEGDDDFLFFSSLKQILLTDFDVAKLYPDVETHTCTTQMLKEFLCSLQIIPLSGEANKIKFRHVCKDIDLKHFFLLDNDALYNNLEKLPKEYKGHLRNYKVGKFLFAFDLQRDEERCKAVEGDITKLESEGIFAWTIPSNHKKGTIECVVSDITDWNDLGEIMFRNHVGIHKPDVGNHSKNQKKLCSDPNLTSQNITNAVEFLVKTTCTQPNQISRLISFLCRYASTNRMHHGVPQTS